MAVSLPIRQSCPQGLCNCGLERLDNLQSLADLEKFSSAYYLLDEQLGIRLSVAPGASEVCSMHDIVISIDELPGLCRKTRQAIPAAIRRGLEKRSEIAYRLLDAHDLFRDS